MQCLSLATFKILFQELIEKTEELSNREQWEALEYAKTYLERYPAGREPEPEQQPDARDEDAGKKTRARKRACPMCDAVFFREGQLVRHVWQHRGSGVSCLRCRGSFRNAVSHDLHLRARLCVPRGVRPSREEDADLEGLLWKDCVRMCPFCAAEFSKSYNLKRHIKRTCDPTERSKTISSKTDCRYACKTCSTKFPTRSLYRKHMKLFKDDKNHKEKNVGNHWCKECAQDFHDRDSLKKHCSRMKHILNVNNGEKESLSKTIICDKCGVAFFSSADLNSHINRIHNKDIAYRCSRPRGADAEPTARIMCHACPASFKTSSAFNSHMNSVHSQVRRFLCNICCKGFKVNSQLTRHKATHASPSLSHMCPYCCVSFRRGSHLTRHISLRHQDPMILSVMNFNKEKAATEAVMMENSKVEEEQVTEEQVFSMINVQSGEFITMTEADLSKNITDNIIPHLWNNMDDYS